MNMNQPITKAKFKPNGANSTSHYYDPPRTGTAVAPLAEGPEFHQIADSLQLIERWSKQWQGKLDKHLRVAGAEEGARRADLERIERLRSSFLRRLRFLFTARF